MLRFDPEAAKCFFREVREVVRHDHACMTVDGCGQHMPIIGIGKMDARYQVLEAGNEAVVHMGVHHRPRPFQSLDGKIRPVSCHGLGPFIVDRRRPSGSEQASNRQLHEEIAKRRRVEDAGIEERDDALYSRPYS